MSRLPQAAQKANSPATQWSAVPNRWSGIAHRQQVGFGIALTALAAACSFTASTDDELVGGGDPNTVQLAGAGGESGSGGTSGGASADAAPSGGTGGVLPIEHGGATGLGGVYQDAGTGGHPPDLDDGGPDAPIGGAEICNNGVDDDGNGQADCADPICIAKGYRCAAAPPSGWSGPLLFYTGETPAPACPAGFPTRIAEGGVTATGTPASCPSCVCGAPTDVKCVAKFTKYYTAGWACSGGAVKKVSLALDSSCTPLPNISDGAWDVGYDGLAVQASCAATAAGKTTKAAVEWSPHRALCGGATTGTSCGAGSACIPPATPPYAAQACIARAGDHVCPSPYLMSFQIYTGFDDTRDCTACSCTAKGACTAQVSMAHDSQCKTSAKVDPGACDYAFWATSTAPTFTSAPSCLPSLSTPTGSVARKDLTTVCCL
ncbi:MAG: hypothetical protein R3B13_30745 [Polyangiaceae bacterium]